MINGSLAFASGGKLIFDPTKTLSVNGAAVTFDGFGISDLVGFSPATPNGTYSLIGGIATTNTNNLVNFGPTNAYGLGGGRSAYFTVGTGLMLEVVPEPGAIGLAGIGLIALAWRRCRPRAGSRRAGYGPPDRRS